MADKPKFQEITSDIDWQRPGFLKYCISITEGNESARGPEEFVVKKILGDYLALAILFSKQFWERIKDQYTVDSISPADVKIKMQEAMDKLVEEWFHVYAVIQSIRGRNSNTESKRIVDLTTPFVDVAMRDVGLVLEDFPVILQFGRSYSMRFSSYNEGFAALSMPLWILGSPWEWTILWHELAGEKVRLIKNDSESKIRNSLLSMFNDALKKLDEEERAKAKVRGWSIDWFEELFEDSFSIIHFPIHFLIVFNNLLERYPDSGRGLRHPPRAVRLAVAMCLHLQMKNFTGLPEAGKWPSWDSWSALNDERSSNEFKRKLEEFIPDQQLPDGLDVRMAWQVAKEILEWHQKAGIAVNTRNDFRNVISEAVIAYSYEDFKKGEKGKILDDTLKAIDALQKPQIDWQDSTDLIYHEICDVVNNTKLSQLGKKKRQQLLDQHPQVKRILDGLGYEELLNLSFTDEDFLKGINSVTNVIYLKSGNWVNANFDYPFLITREVKEVADAGHDVEFTVTEKVNGRDTSTIYKTNKKNWNNSVGNLNILA